jgi:hypothetical protein
MHALTRWGLGHGAPGGHRDCGAVELGGQARGAGHAPRFGGDADVEAVLGGDGIDCFPHAWEGVRVAVGVDVCDVNARRLECRQLGGALGSDIGRVQAARERACDQR